MKKWLGGVILVIICVFAVYFYQTTHQPKVNSLEDIVSDKAIYYLYGYDLNKTITDFQRTSFFQKISSSHFYASLIQPKLEKLNQRAPLLSDFISSDAAIAVFSLGKTGSIAKSDDDAGDILILLRFNAKKYPQIKKAFLDFCKVVAAKGQANKDIHYAFFSDVLAVANKEELIKECTALYRKQANSSLSDKKEFQEAKKLVVKDALLWGYQDAKNYFNSFQKMLDESLKSSDPKEARSAKLLAKTPFLSNFGSIFKGSVFFVSYDSPKTGFIAKTFASYDRSQDKEGIIDLIASGRHIDNGVFNLISSMPVGYYAGSQDIQKLYDFYKKILMDFVKLASDNNQALKTEAIDDAFNKARSFLGVDIEKDIISLLGNNFALVFDGLNNADIVITVPQAKAGLPPRQINIPTVNPKFYALFELKNVAAMDKTMAKMSSSIVDNVNKSSEQEKKEELDAAAKTAPKSDDAKDVQPPVEKKKTVELKVETYKGVPINYFDIADVPVEFLKPNYCIAGKYLILSPSVALTESILDTYNSKKDKQAAVQSDFSTVMFVNLRRLINDVKGLKVYDNFRARLAKFPSSNFSVSDLDNFISILESCSTINLSTKMYNADTLESTLSVKIEGL